MYSRHGKAPQPQTGGIRWLGIWYVMSVTHVGLGAVIVKFFPDSSAPLADGRPEASSSSAVTDGCPGIRLDASSGRPNGSHNGSPHTARPPTAADSRARHDAQETAHACGTPDSWCSI